MNLIPFAVLAVMFMLNVTLALVAYHYGYSNNKCWGKYYTRITRFMLKHPIFVNLLFFATAFSIFFFGIVIDILLAIANIWYFYCVGSSNFHRDERIKNDNEAVFDLD